ncbi:MAG TPA: hypothetical protein VGI19_15310 [Candidatus Cybelea sp.]|jgi:hypothetical protein
MRAFLLGVAATLLTACAVAWFAVSEGFIPVNADAAPSSLERWGARTALRAGVQRRMVHRTVAYGDTALMTGVDTYVHDCQMCHGDASGRPGVVARGLYQRPPQFAKHGAEDIPIS